MSSPLNDILQLITNFYPSLAPKSKLSTINNDARKASIIFL
jgi:hypothetical protein